MLDHLGDILYRLGDVAGARKQWQRSMERLGQVNADARDDLKQLKLALQQKLKQVEAGLVVMTTHGRGAVSRFWLGSVADKLVRQLPMPVLLVRPHEPAPDFAHPPIFRRALIPLDGSTLAEQILPHALGLGGLTQAEFTLFQV